MPARSVVWFPVWALLLSAVAYLWPGVFTPLASAIVPLLGLVMLGMGMTLTPASFAAVARRPDTVGLGVLLQFLLMPALAWGVGMTLGLSPALLAGLVLVGSCPGGTASNVMCYLARGDVALSITLTAVSTLLAVVATPVLTWLYVGEVVPVPVRDMLWTILMVVLLPVTAGIAINARWGARLGPVRDWFPVLSVAAIVIIIAIIVALNRDEIATVGAAVVVAVVLHNGLGLAGGYTLAWLTRRDEAARRAIAVEVGMQNSGLGVALALAHFTPAAALPGALFSIWHNLSGAALAAFWARRPIGGLARESL